MLKYSDIISKLSDVQKIRILTNIGNLSGKDLKILGIPSIKPGALKDYCRGVLPHAQELVRSFDTQLFGAAAKQRLGQMVKDGVNFVKLDGAKPKICPYRKEISEDSYLASEMAAVSGKATTESGLMSGFAGYYLTDADVEWMDSTPSERIISEYVTRPYKSALSKSGAACVITSTRMLGDAYEGVGSQMLEGIAKDSEFVVCEHATDENTVELIKDGVICFEASMNALESAYSRYKKMRQLIDRGAADEAQIAEEERINTAISPEALDKATDHALDFIYRCADVKAVPQPTDYDDIALSAALGSTVLMKNKNGVLPLSAGEKVAVIGDVAASGIAERCADALFGMGYVIVGSCAGYDASDPSSNEGVGAAVELAAAADTVVLLLGAGYNSDRDIPRTHTLTLPANQLYLADRLADLNKKVIAVISGVYSTDVDFIRPHAALLLAPLEVECAHTALAAVLSGEYNPSGRLASTMYVGTDFAFKKRAVYRDYYGIKSGPFIGYRYYDTAGMKVGYPFGHGLSYTTFRYSALRVSGSVASVEVCNTGSVRGAEIVQFYVGICGSAFIRPKKELAGFARVELDPGESKRVSVELDIPEIYVDGELAREGGTYRLSVGSSVSDIRLEKLFVTEGVNPSPSDERIIDYLQSVTNVVEDKYTLEAEYSPMKKSIKNIVFGAGSVILAAAIALFNTISGLSAPFLSVIAGVLAVMAIVFLVMEIRERSIAHEAEQQEILAANRKLFDGAEEVQNIYTSKIFHDEFDAVSDDDTADMAVADDIEDENRAKFIDSSFTATSFAEELAKFTLDRGYKFEPGVIESLCASIATSRLIITYGMSDADFNTLTMLLAEYFGTEAYVDDGSNIGDGSNFYVYDNNGEKIKRNVFLALRAAVNYPEKMQITALVGAKSEGLSGYLAPFMRYLGAQRVKNEINIINELGVNIGCTIPPNLWVVINLAEGESISSVPASVARLASVNRIKFTRLEAAADMIIPHGINRYQAEYIAEKAVGKLEISEDLWKKVDKLEKYAMEHSEYRIGNKLWLAFEKHIAVLLSSGAELADAADATIANRLLPSIVSTLRGNLTSEDRTVTEALEFIFGDDGIDECKRFIDSISDDSVKHSESKDDIGSTAKAEEPAAADILQETTEE